MTTLFCKIPALSMDAPSTWMSAVLLKVNLIKDPLVYKQELFSKTFRFRKWLLAHYPELESYLHARLESIIGPEMDSMTPKLKVLEEGD